jgi:sRNA-binding protein
MEENQLDLFGKSNISDSPVLREKDRVAKAHKIERNYERKRAREQKEKDEQEAKMMAKQRTIGENERIREAREASSPTVRKTGEKKPYLGLE